VETANTSLAVAERLIALLDKPTEIRVRELVRLCCQLNQQCQEDQEACLTRSWWRLFNQAGICLREALDQAKTEYYQKLSDQEVEQAYFLLIQVAYFFEPGGIAETLWPLLPAEAGDQQARPPRGDALGIAFASSPRVPAGARIRQQARRLIGRLDQLLGRGNTRDRESAELLARAAQQLPSPGEEAALPHSFVARRTPNGMHPGR
jgi:hypothetical protein